MYRACFPWRVAILGIGRRGRGAVRGLRGSSLAVSRRLGAARVRGRERGKTRGRVGSRPPPPTRRARPGLARHHVGGVRPAPRLHLQLHDPLHAGRRAVLLGLLALGMVPDVRPGRDDDGPITVEGAAEADGPGGAAAGAVPGSEDGAERAPSPRAGASSWAPRERLRLRMGRRRTVGVLLGLGGRVDSVRVCTRASAATTPTSASPAASTAPRWARPPAGSTCKGAAPSTCRCGSTRATCG